MKDLIKQAIVLIYPDGKVDKIPITTFKYHMDYFGQHLQKLKKLAKSTRREKILLEYFKGLCLQ